MVLSRSREAYSLLKFSKCHSKKIAFEISDHILDFLLDNFGF
jgi:S-adenosylmethionine synthetase